MTARGALALSLAFALSGCARTHQLDERWRPLLEVVERPDLPLLSPTATSTIGRRIYVVNLDEWLQRFPPGSVQYDALLLHEQEHARRELRMGVDRFLARYFHDPAFQWQEEQRGWYLQIRHLVRNGQSVDARVAATILSQYRNFQGPMVSFDDALAWVRAVLAGQWTPPPEEPSG